MSHSVVHLLKETNVALVTLKGDWYTLQCWDQASLT